MLDGDPELEYLLDLALLLLLLLNWEGCVPELGLMLELELELEGLVEV